MNDRLKRACVPGIPFLFSLLLSSFTVGSTVFWQDSGFYLTAVHEMSVLYPHGFILYQVLCKAWTLAAAPVFGFTLAVHLFSSIAAACGAGFASLAARDFLRRVEPGKPAELPAIAAGCLLAGGYCYAHAAILAKGYALFTALLALLLWLLSRAERKRDFLCMGAVLGFSWAAHPAAALLLPGMLVYAAVRRDRIREWGWGFVAGVTGIAAACAFLPSLLLPVLAARESLADFGSPRTAGDVVRYLTGERFTGQTGAFGVEAWRWISGARYAWEEYLGGGVLLLAAGTVKLYRVRRGLLGLLAAWIVPVAGMTLLFKAEGQFDQWLVAAFVPMSLLVALGISWVSERGRTASFAAAGAALAWLLVVNVPLLNQRGYDWAEQYGRMLLNNLDPDAVVLFSRDDPLALAQYLQQVRGHRTDLVPLSNTMLGQDWLDRRLLQRRGLRIPEYGVWRGRMPGAAWELVATTAFANENAGRGRAIFTDIRPSDEFLRPDLTVTPAGMLWKIVPRSEAGVNLSYWDYPIRPESIPRGSRRARGHWNYITEEGNVVRPEFYEDRFFLPLLWSKARLADVYLPTDPVRALALYDEVFKAYPESSREPRLLYHRAVALYSLGRPADALLVLRALMAVKPPPEISIFALFYLGEVSASLGRKEEGAGYYREALRAGPPPALRQALEQRLRSP
jgi:tetratricopeptide (TPR) repeat protein